MMTLIAAALVAAQPAAVPADAPQHAPMMQMGAQQGHEQDGQMADMKDCCCKDMMAKMHGGHPAAHEDHQAQ